MHVSHIMHACTCIYTAYADGVVIAEVPNPAVSADILKDVLLWKVAGATFDDIIVRLRQRTVPSGYTYHTRVQGTCTCTCIYTHTMYECQGYLGVVHTFSDFRQG